MNFLDSDIEQTLRRSPRPLPPATLQDSLIRQISLPGPHEGAAPSWRPRGTAAAWWRRWWPALAPAALSVACVVTVGVQQMEINDLRRILEPLVAAQPADQTDAASNYDPSAARPAADIDQTLELARLRELVDRLASEIAGLEKLRAENKTLQASLQADLGLAVTADEAAALAAAYEKAQVITCLNNLKQLGLAAHIWAKDHDDVFPPSLSELTGQLPGSVMVCPVDAQNGNQRPYEFLRPGAEAYKEPSLVLFRCPNHGNICIGDGSAHMKVAEEHPEQLVDRDGALYYEPNRAVPAKAQPE